jgi:predicted GIY-YIG superfamily endonuclease
LQDTTDFINFINRVNSSNSLPANAILVSADVSALYTNIPHNDGLLACREALDKRSNPNPPTDHLIRLLELILKLNHFEFNNKYYLQIKGTAMGSPTAPSYANTFMGKLEEDMLGSAPTSPFCWKRFIDDVFFIWTSSEQDLDDFKIHMNSFHNSIKFTFESSNERVSFLDVCIQLVDCKVITSLYSKPTDAHSYVLPTSSHPYHIFKSIPYSQCLRIKRICSENEDAEKHIQDLQNHLSKRGYDLDLIKESVEKAKTLDRSSLLVYKEKERNNRVPLVLTYDKKLADASKTVKKHLDTLHEDEKLKKVFPDPPLISFRRNRNLRDLLVSARLPILPGDDSYLKPGFYECPSKKCSVRQFIVTGDKFTSFVTKQNFPIIDHIHDKMSWLIYLITCKRCQQQYVGKTTTSLYTRFTGHKSDIKLYKTPKGKQLPIGKHFNTHNHTIDDMSIIGIESIRRKENAIILHRESFWIKKLCTLSPRGINVEE